MIRIARINDPLKALETQTSAEIARLKALEEHRARTEAERNRLNEILRQTDVMIAAKRAELDVLHGSFIDIPALESELVL